MRSDLSNTGTDTVGGLRVLRGIGGEGVFLDRYRRESQATRTAAVNVAKLQSVLDALQVFLPGIFVVLVVWLGARSAVTGAITAGELVAFYGYAAFLMLPLRTATEFANKLIRGRVAAYRMAVERDDSPSDRRRQGRTPLCRPGRAPAPSAPVDRTGTARPRGTERAGRAARGPTSTGSAGRWRCRACSRCRLS